MKIYCPSIAWHNLEPVLSLDIKRLDTDLYKVITSGADRHLVVWKVTLGDGLRENPETNDDASPEGMNQTGDDREEDRGAKDGKGETRNGSSDVNKLKEITIEPLADLNRHQKAINAVRFSPNINVFASGDDEGNIFVWKLHDKSMDPTEETAKLGSGNCFDDTEGIINEEDWCVWKTLRGHNDDVVDLCWSPNGKFLMSGSVGCEAIVWDVNKGVRLNILEDSKGYVQGVAWDPCDDYIATLSTDRSLRIYDSTTKKRVYSINKSVIRMDDDTVKNTRLFYDDTLPTYSRRMCFSPGGELLLTPAGVVELNDPDEDNFKFINAVHIFARDCLNKPTCYLSTGHLSNTAVKCCPQRFELRKGFDNPYPFSYRIVFAVATQESLAQSQVLLYDTQQQTPFAMISDVHYTRLTDISWSDDGRLLVISSTDGYCTFIIFNDLELGIPYKGPDYKYVTTPTKETVQKTAHQSPDSAQKKTPEVTRITNFFKKIDKSVVQSPISTPPQPISVKRKDAIEILDDGPTSKRVCLQSTLLHAPTRPSHTLS